MSQVSQKTKITLVAGLLLAGFVALVGLSGLSSEGNSDAAVEKEVSCVTKVPIEFKLGPNKLDRMLVATNITTDNASGEWVVNRTYDIGQNLEPGKYRIFGTSSDDHYNHGYVAGADVPGVGGHQNHEQYYTILGTLSDSGDYRTPKPTLDVPDNVDWMVGEGSQFYFRDEDGEVLNGSDKVAALTDGDPGYGYDMGIIHLDESRDKVTFVHKYYFDKSISDDVTSRYDGSNPQSVIPNSIFIQCIEPLSSDLAIQKTVDGNSDGTFSEVEEIVENSEFTWRVVASNNGAGDELSAAIVEKLPSGVSLVGGSAKVTSAPSTGDGSLTETSDGFNWNGKLNSKESITIEFKTKVTDQAAFDECVTATTNASKCRNTATVGVRDSSNNFESKDQDAADTTLAQPTLAITKKVDGDNDGSYSESETISPKDGANFKWQVVIQNTGKGTGSNLVMRDEMPAGVTVSSVTAEPSNIGTTSSADNVVVWKGDLAPGAKITFTINARIADLAAFKSCDNDSSVATNKSSDSRCVNMAELGEADPNDPNKPKDPIKDPAQVAANLAANLAVKKYSDGIDSDSGTKFSDDEAEEVKEGTPFTWKVTGTNTGDADEPNARIVDEIPAGLTLDPANQSISATGGGTVSILTDSGKTYVVWNGALNVDATVSFEYTTSVSGEAEFATCDKLDAADDVCVNEAALGVAAAGTADGPEGTGLTGDSKVTDTAKVTATFAPEYAIKKYVDGNNDGNFNDNQEQGEVDKTFKYRIVGSNTGNGEADNVRVVDILPAGVELVSAESAISATTSSGSTGTVSTGANGTNDKYVAWDGSLKVGETVTIEFEVKIADEAAYNSCKGSGSSCSNEAAIGTPPKDGTDPTAVENKKVDPAAIVMTPEGELVITKQVDTDNDGTWSDSETIRPAEQFSWKVTLSNQGDGTIKNAAMYDVLPVGVSLVGEPRIEPEGYGTVTSESGSRFSVFWTKAEFEPGGSVAIVFDAIVSDYDAFDKCDEDDGSGDDYCTNNAVAGEGTEPDNFKPGEKEAKAKVDIEKYPVIEMSKTVDASDDDSDFNKLETHSTSSDQQIVWQVEIENTGNKEAANVNFSDTVHSSMSVESATLDGAEDDDLVVDGNDVTWTGELAIGQVITIQITADMVDDDAFEACDIADGEDDGICENTANVSYPVTVTKPGGEEETTTKELESTAKITLDPSLPELSLEKLVDANEDDEFSEKENYEIGKDIVWRSTITNTGDGPAKNAKFEDTIIKGQKYVEDSVKISIGSGGAGGEGNGAVAADGVISWVGLVPAGSSVVIEFTTTIDSLQDFATCNFSDGDSEDSLCSNTANLYSSADDDDPLATSVARISTDLPVVLAVTGVSTTGVGISVGLTIALVAILLAVVSIFGRRASGKKG